MIWKKTDFLWNFSWRSEKRKKQWRKQLIEILVFWYDRYLDEIDLNHMLSSRSHTSSIESISNHLDHHLYTIYLYYTVQALAVTRSADEEKVLAMSLGLKIKGGQKSRVTVVSIADVSWMAVCRSFLDVSCFLALLNPQPLLYARMPHNCGWRRWYGCTVQCVCTL
jgi:hypothetical protein